MISKEEFCHVIESLRIQVAVDRDRSEALQDALQVQVKFPYDNSALFKAVLFLLHRYFPRGFDGFCEIEHHCFFIEFGKMNEQYLISTEDLYDRLISKL